jgi:hypothetical protein
MVAQAVMRRRNLPAQFNSRDVARSAIERSVEVAAADSAESSTRNRARTVYSCVYILLWLPFAIAVAIEGVARA